MARVTEDVQQFNFSGGLNTEATPLTFPENAGTKFDNVDLQRNGSARRRLGVDFESNFDTRTFFQVTTNDLGINTFRWKTVAGVGGLDFVVVQVGHSLYIYDGTANSFSANEVGVVALNSFELPGATRTTELGFASGNGFLFVVGSEINPVYIEYDTVAETFTANQITIRIRDFDGLDDGLDPGERPSTLSIEHQYNLLNQGWPWDFDLYPNEVGNGSQPRGQPIIYTNTRLSFYPSNSDLFQFGKGSVAQDSFNIGNYSPWQLRKNNFGNTQAPKGRFILEAFNRDRAAAANETAGHTGVVGLGLVAGTIPVESYDSRPSCTAFFAGRVWYAGLTDGELTGSVYFSQLLTSVDKAGDCFQEYDPTAEQLNSLLATDGGVIEIPDAGRIYRLIPYDRGVVVVADNGVWQIIGSDESGFTASTYFIRLVSTVGALGPSTVAQIEGGVVYWAEQGIYLLSPDETGQLSEQNLTLTTIQDTYLGIPQTARSKARAFYDNETNKMIWLYNSRPATTDTEYNFDKFLYLDINLGAFYEYTITEVANKAFDIILGNDDIVLGNDDVVHTQSPFASSYDASPFIIGIVKKSGLTVADETFDVVLGSDDVVLSTDDIVHTQQTGVSATESAIKLVTFAPWNISEYRMTFSEFKDRGFYDWNTVSIDDGMDYTSEIITGYKLFGEAARDKQIKYMTVHFERTEENWVANNDDLTLDFPSGATMRVRFDFTTSATPNKWSQTFEAYKLKVPYFVDNAGPFDYGYEVISTKNRVRGVGKALQFQITSQEGKDFRLLGWDATITGRSRV